jgi:hypothetical protein
LWKSAAYRRSPATASPSNTAWVDELSTATIAAVPLTVGVHPRICPDAVSKRNREAPLTPFWLTAKSVVVGFATVPVGPPGTVTVVATLEPTPL